MNERLKKNRRRIELLLFVESLSLHLEVGFDLAYAWERAQETLVAQRTDLVEELSLGDAGLSATLARLGECASVEEGRLWFSLLALLYREGSPLVAAAQAFRSQLVAVIDAGVVQHTEEFPHRASLILLFFFLPPAFVLLFYPLLQQGMALGPLS